MKFEKNEKNWQEMLELYIDYRHEFECEPGCETVYKNKNLGMWVRMQRDLMNNDHLAAQRKQKLVEVGFQFSPKKDRDNLRWQKMFELYKEFKQEFGREPKQKEKYKGENLGEWVNTQRRNIKKENFLKERKDKLVSAGFDFDPFEARWEYMFELYKEFKQKFGREPKTKERYKGEELGAWVSMWAYNIKHGNIDPAREARLNEVAFRSQGPQNKLQKMIDLYLEFKEEYNREPMQNESFKGENLGVWLTNQKKNANRGEMSTGRMEQLTNAGVVLCTGRRKVKWSEACLLYIKYVQKNGCGPSRNEIYRNVSLGQWVVVQRGRLKTDRETLKQQYKEFLFENGYSEDPLKLYWQEMYNLCLEFMKSYNRLPKNKEIYKEKPLGNWLLYQKKLLKYNSLSENQYRLLTILYTRNNKE